jgi:hypothetical protein
MKYKILLLLSVITFAQAIVSLAQTDDDFATTLYKD